MVEIVSYDGYTILPAFGKLTLDEASGLLKTKWNRSILLRVNDWVVYNIDFERNEYHADESNKLPSILNMDKMFSAENNLALAALLWWVEIHCGTSTYRNEYDHHVSILIETISLYDWKTVFLMTVAYAQRHDFDRLDLSHAQWVREASEIHARYGMNAVTEYGFLLESSNYTTADVINAIDNGIDVETYAAYKESKGASV